MEEMKKKKMIRSSAAVVIAFSVVFLMVCVAPQPSEAKRKVSIPDELDDVVDDEEDEAWKEWGKKTTPITDFDPPSYDFSKMGLEEMQMEMMKRHVGPTFGFVKLRLGVPRSRDDMTEIARRWSKVLRTGSVEVTFMAVDLNTIMFTMEKGQNTLELKDFILSQEEAYEVKIGDQLFRRHGDPPLDEVLEKLRKGKTLDDQLNSGEESDHHRNEL